MVYIDELDKEMRLRFGATRVKLRHGPLVDNVYYNVVAGVMFADLEKFAVQNELRVIIDHGTSDIVIEVPRKNRKPVLLKDLMKSNEYKNSDASLPIILGVNTLGRPVIYDLKLMPHLLIGGHGATGKSTFLHSTILTLASRLSQQQCKFLLVNTENSEFQVYSNAQYLYQPIITDRKSAIKALKNIVAEIDVRFQKLCTVDARNIQQYNQKNVEQMPYVIVVIYDFSELMIFSESEFTECVRQIYRKARAVGIHLIMATTYLDQQIMPDKLLANFPLRIAFQTWDKAESECFLGESGSETLLDYGDVLFSEGGKQPMRIHTPYVDVSDGLNQFTK